MLQTGVRNVYSLTIEFLGKVMEKKKKKKLMRDASLGIDAHVKMLQKKPWLIQNLAY